MSMETVSGKHTFFPLIVLLASLCVRRSREVRARALALSAIQTRLQRINEGDLSAAVEPEALTEARRLAGFTWQDEADQLDVWHSLGWLYFVRCLELPESDHQVNLEAAVEFLTPCFMTGVGVLPETLLPTLADAAEPTALRLLEQALASPEPASTFAAVDLWQRLLHASPPEHPDRAGRMSNLGTALQIRFKHTGDQADLDVAVQLRRIAVVATSPDHPNRAGRLNNLGIALLDRFHLLGEQRDLDEAILACQEAAAATPDGHPEQADHLGSLGLVLQLRYGRTGEQRDLEEAIAACRAAAAATPAGHAESAYRLSNLSVALWSRFGRTGGQADLDEAILVGREAAKAAPADSSDVAGWLSNLCGALLTRFERTGARADLDEAILIGREAIAAAPADDPHRAKYLSNLSAALRNRFESTGEQGDLEESIDIIRAGVATVPADHPDRATCLSNLGLALLLQFQVTEVQADLEEAIHAGRKAVELVPADHPNRAGWLSNLAATLWTRFERVGDQADLDEAIRLGREAVETTPADHPNRAGWLSNLAAALRMRFERVGDRADLEQAIQVSREAVAAVPADHPLRAGLLSNLGLVLRARFGRIGDQADLDEAIVVGREAVAATPTSHPDHAGWLNNLGAALQVRYELVGDQADLEEAIQTTREGVAGTPEHHSYRARWMSNLGAALRMRFERVGDRADLDEAIRLGREAVETTLVNHPDRARWLNMLGAALRTRFESTGRQADLNAAASAYTDAWESSAAPSARLRAARAAAHMLAQSDEGRAKAADVLQAAVLLLPEVASRQLVRADQQHELGVYAGLVGDAAALTLADARGVGQERAARALQLLETGRAVLLSQAFDTRSDLTDLHRKHPNLAARFVALRDRLDQPENSVPVAVVGGSPGTQLDGEDLLVRDRRRLAREFASVLAEIRAHDEFASFGLPPAMDELVAQSAHGPVVVFNISGYGSDALLLTETGVTAVPLPGLRYITLIDRINAFHQALSTAVLGKTGASRREAQGTLSRILEWLWDTAVEPVLTALGHDSQPPPLAIWPRVWWAPGGLLGLLPVHAAGYHTDPADRPGRRTVLDRVISSYTPTVRALAYTRQVLPTPASPADALIVAMPTTPGLPDRDRLSHVLAEVEKLRHHLTDPVLLHEPERDRSPADVPATLPTKANVLAHLPTCSIAHFACHAASDPTDPSKSLLLLHDHEKEPLTVAALAPVRLDHAQLAYLSACRTAAIGAENLLDEAIHLTSAFQLAGFPHVIGTLWEIDDQTAVTIADTFYTRLATDSGALDTSRAAEALQHAVRAVRDGHGLPGGLTRVHTPSLWAAYLHAGA
ncbi:CHAT domain-containing protein [Streptomyces sp. R35]|uniref:CHAT domain-containing protein n=1 Tax=Streptomyces sp. R35 TaxID=3238630 RepID=A0AB39SHF5_9ACTN